MTHYQRQELLNDLYANFKEYAERARDYIRAACEERMHGTHSAHLYALRQAGIARRYAVAYREAYVLQSRNVM